MAPPTAQTLLEQKIRDAHTAAQREITLSLAEAERLVRLLNEKDKQGTSVFRATRGEHP